MKIYNTHNVFDAVARYINYDATAILKQATSYYTDKDNQLMVIFDTGPHVAHPLRGKKFLCESFGIEDDANETLVKELKLKEYAFMKVFEIENE